MYVTSSEDLRLYLVGELVRAARQYADGRTVSKFISAGEFLTSLEYGKVKKFTPEQFAMTAQDAQHRLNNESIPVRVDHQPPTGFSFIFAVVPPQPRC